MSCSATNCRLSTYSTWLSPHKMPPKRSSAALSKQPLFRGGSGSDDDDDAAGHASSTHDDESGVSDKGEGSSRGGGASSSRRGSQSRSRASSVTSNATTRSVALSETSVADYQAQQAAAAGVGGAAGDEEEEDDDDGYLDPEDDPDVIASIPVYLARSIPPEARLQVFQFPTYPAGRPLPVPASAEERGLQETARWRKNANWVELDLPLDMRPKVYSQSRGQELAKDLRPDGADDQHSSSGGKGKVKREDGSREQRKGTKRLDKMKLQSDEVPKSTPYMIGVMRDGASGSAQTAKSICKWEPC